MGKRVFHGSSHIVERPIFGGGRTHNDYGPGFYCTEQLCMAQEWAVDIARDGFANVYDIDLAGLSILHLNSDEYSTLGWLAVLLENREFDVPSPLAFEAREYLLANFLPAYRDYDIITGYRATTAIFPLRRTSSTEPSPYASCNMPCTWGNSGVNLSSKASGRLSASRLLRRGRPVLSTGMGKSRCGTKPPVAITSTFRATNVRRAISTCSRS